MNPYDLVLNRVLTARPVEGRAASIILILKLASANYADDCPSNANPYRWVVEQLRKVYPAEILETLWGELIPASQRWTPPGAIGA